jgi:hypothetical protein
MLDAWLAAEFDLDEESQLAFCWLKAAPALVESDRGHAVDRPSPHRSFALRAAA